MLSTILWMIGIFSIFIALGLSRMVYVQGGAGEFREWARTKQAKGIFFGFFGVTVGMVAVAIFVVLVFAQPAKADESPEWDFFNYAGLRGGLVATYSDNGVCHQYKDDRLISDVDLYLNAATMRYGRFSLNADIILWTHNSCALAPDDNQLDGAGFDFDLRLNF